MKWNTRNLEQINKMSKGTLLEHLEIVFTDISDEGIKAQMPIREITHQPMGLLHGGASVALIESIASMGSALLCDLEHYAPVGLEVNANHLRSAKSGEVEGSARLIHHGKQTHVWLVDLHHVQTEKLLCSGRITIMIVKKNA